MTSLNLCNPFSAPIYHKEIVTSTMDISRQLAAAGESHGTVITADFQEAGRGRGIGRIWETRKGVNLLFTILLRYPNIEHVPSALTLRAGLAVALAIEDFAPSLRNKLKVKWTNDIMINCKKAAGILCEAETAGNVHLGIGVNVAQKEFPTHLRKKATSIALAVNNEHGIQEDRFPLLEKILIHLYNELETPMEETWKPRLEQRLYKKGEQVTFIEGTPDSGKKINGTITGIGEQGELLILSDNETLPRTYITGELYTPH